MSFLTRMFTYLILDLTITNLIIFYGIEHLPLLLVLLVSIVEIRALTAGHGFLGWSIQTQMVNVIDNGLRHLR